MPPGTPLRNVRVPDDLWDAAGVKARNENTDRSEVIRRLLEQWLDQTIASAESS